MKRVLVLVPKGAELLETAAFFDVLGWASEEGRGEPVRAVAAGASREVRCAFGPRLVVDLLFSDVDVDEFDALAVPGGFEEYGFYEEAYSEAVSRIVAAFHRAAKPIASICVGALLLAHSGVLEGRRATTYHLGGGRRRRQLAELGARVVDEPIVRDGNCITSTAPATAVEVALALVEILTDRHNAARIRRLMGFH